MFEPDNFAGRPYEFVTNQISHTFFVGLVVIVFGSSLVSLSVFGELPPKWLIVLIGAVGYLAYELVFQGWRGGDTIQDWVFVNVHGVWSGVSIFSAVPPEISEIIGRHSFTGDMFVALGCFTVFLIHLLAGAVWRWIEF